MIGLPTTWGFYNTGNENAGLPEEAKVLKRTNKKRVYQNIRISPDGYHLAYITNQKGQYKVWIQDTCLR